MFTTHANKLEHSRTRQYSAVELSCLGYISSAAENVQSGIASKTKGA